MRRRHFVAALGAAAISPRLAFAGVQRAPLAEAFLMLDSYLALPPAERSRFSFAYRLMRGGKPAPDAQAVIVDPAGVRTPIILSPDGTVQTLPTLAQLKSKAAFEIDGADFQFVLEPLADIAPGTRAEVADLVAALGQLNKAITRFAGDASDQVAKLTAAYFPGARSGAAVSADGAATPLATFDFQALGPTPYLELDKARTAVAATFDRPFSRVVLAGRPRR